MKPNLYCEGCGKKADFDHDGWLVSPCDCGCKMWTNLPSTDLRAVVQHFIDADRKRDIRDLTRLYSLASPPETL